MYMWVVGEVKRRDAVAWCADKAEAHARRRRDATSAWILLTVGAEKPSRCKKLIWGSTATERRTIRALSFLIGQFVSWLVFWLGHELT